MAKKRPAKKDEPQVSEKKAKKKPKKGKKTPKKTLKTAGKTPKKTGKGKKTKQELEQEELALLLEGEMGEQPGDTDD